MLPAEQAPTSTRIDALDAIRGVAVLGIFVINIIGFGISETGFANPLLVGGDGALNDGLWSFAYIFVEGSMRGLFALLFGAGIVLFTARAAYPDGPIRIADLYYRRTLWLIIFGLVHSYVLLAPGDILLIYGIAGILLFPFRILSPKRLLVLASILLIAITLANLDDELAEDAIYREAMRVEEVVRQGQAITEEQQQVLDDWQERVTYNWPSKKKMAAHSAARTGDLAALYSSNAQWVNENSDFPGIAWWVVDGIMMMFLGMALFKLGVLTGERNTAFYLRLTLIAYGFGLAFRVWAVHSRWAVEFSPELWAWASFGQVARLAMTLGHIGLFFLVWKLAAGSRLMRALTAAGRMALTNYVGQTIIANLIFSGIGLGLYATVNFSELYLIMLAIWIAQLLFSVWWLARFRYGPLEWLWRNLTYGKRQPLRR